MPKPGSEVVVGVGVGAGLGRVHAPAEGEGKHLALVRPLHRYGVQLRQAARDSSSRLRFRHLGLRQGAVRNEGLHAAVAKGAHHLRSPPRPAGSLNNRHLRLTGCAA